MAQQMLSKPATMAIQDAVAAGLLVVGAAGNFGMDACKHFPAAGPDMMGMPKRDPNVLIAGVINSQDQAVSSAVVNGSLVQFDYGNCIDLYAPGLDIVSTGAPGPNTGDRGETMSSGTSLAAAHVTGVVALYLERFPRSTPNQIKLALQQQATGGAVMGPPPGAMLLFNGNSSAFTLRAIQLGIPVASQPVMQKGELWHSTSFVLNAVANRTATLSADLARSSGTAVDDVLKLDCVDIDQMGQSFGLTRSTTLDYNTDGPCQGIRSIVPQNLNNLLVRNQAQRCQLQLQDVCGGARSSTRLFLNF